MPYLSREAFCALLEQGGVLIVPFLRGVSYLRGGGQS